MLVRFNKQQILGVIWGVAGIDDKKKNNSLLELPAVFPTFITLVAKLTN